MIAVLSFAVAVVSAAPVEMTIGYFTADQAEGACAYADTAGAYVCDRKILEGAIATRVRYEAFAAKDLEAVVVPIVEGTEGRCTTDPSPACVARVPASTGCIKGVLLAAKSPKARLKIDWNEVTFTVAHRAVPVVLASIRDLTSFVQQRPSVSPQGANIVEEVYQPGSACLLPRVPPPMGDSVVFNMPAIIGGKPVELNWRLERQRVAATETELFRALRRPAIDKAALVDPGPWVEPSNMSKQQRDNLHFRYRTAKEAYEKAKQVPLHQAAYDAKAAQLGIEPARADTQ